MTDEVPTPGQFLEQYSDLIREHREWLSRVDGWRLKRWNDTLDSQVETALCEALVRRLLTKHVDTVTPAEDHSAGGPDFRCMKSGNAFYVESTCLTVEAVVRESGLSHHPRPEVCGYRLLTRLFHYACLEKAKQCGKMKDAPCLLAIGTLHSDASLMCFGDVELGFALTSEPKITILRDRRAGSPIGKSYDTTDLRFAAFLVRTPNEPSKVMHARLSISALLLCGFGCRPPTVRGVINSHAKRPFDPGLLPNVEFGRIREGDGTISVVWG